MKKLLLLFTVLLNQCHTTFNKENSTPLACCSTNTTDEQKLDNKTSPIVHIPQFAAPITNLLKPRNLLARFELAEQTLPGSIPAKLIACFQEYGETIIYPILERYIGRQLTQTGHDMVRKEIYTGDLLEPSKITLTYSGEQSLERTVLALEKNGFAHHFIINTNGDIHPVTREDETIEQALKHRFYSLGKSFFKGLRDMNSASISISLVGINDTYAPIEQKQALIDLLTFLEQKYKITPDNVVDYGCIAYPYFRDNRTPQEYLPWEELAAAGVATYPTQNDWHSTQDNFENQHERTKWTSLALIKLGYNCDVTCNPNNEKLKPALMVFKKHVRLADGTSNITPETIGALNAMIIQHEKCNPERKDIEPPARPIIHDYDVKGSAPMA